MALVNSNRWEILIFEGPDAPAANAPNSAFKNVGHATGCSFASSVSNIVTTNKASLSQVMRIAGQKDSSGSVSGYTDLNQQAQPLQGAPGATEVAAAATVNASGLFGYIQAGTTLYLRIGIDNARFTLPALGSNFTSSGETDGVSEYTFDFEQAGAPAFDEDVTSA